MANNYELLLIQLNEQPNLQYLQVDYRNLIESLKDTNLNLKQMIGILFAAEKDCFHFTEEIDQLKQYSKQQQLIPNESAIKNQSISSSNSSDEFKEIIYEFEQKLIAIVQKMTKYSLINLQLNNFDQLTYTTSLELIQKYIDHKCINNEVNKILNQQLQDEMVKQKQKNYTLQLENMKILANIPNSNINQNKKQTFLFRDKLKIKLQTILQCLSSFKKELNLFKEITDQQYKQYFDRVIIFDQLLTNAQFTSIYNSLLKQLKEQKSGRNINLFVKQSLQASQELNNQQIVNVFEQFQKKLINQINKTITQVTINFEEIIKHNIRDQNYLSQILDETKLNFSKCLKISKAIRDIQIDKDNLENQVRTQLKTLVYKLNEENMKLKLLNLTKVIEGQIQKKSHSSLQSLRSIQY